METEQTQYTELAQLLNVPSLVLKREDLHKFGSHKGRSIPFMIDKYSKDYSNFVISSSGNAALAAIRYINELNNNYTLKVFVGKNIDPEKLDILKNEINNKNITIEQVDRPKQSAFQVDKEGKAKILRQSTDDTALDGYKSLANELMEIKNLKAVFIPTSSGTTAEALGKFLPPEIQIHIVQTSTCHPIAEEFDKDFTTENQSVAGAIVDKIAHRRNNLIEIIKNSNGFGWVVNDDEIQKAINIVKEKTDIDISPNSALSIAGLQKAVNKEWKFIGTVVCLITGK
jgi:threonine dehydratase